MSNYQGKHTKKPSNQETTTPRRARRYRGDYADARRKNPSEPEDARRSPEPEREAPVYVPPEVPQDNRPVNVAEQPTPDEGGSGRNIWVAVVVIAILLVIAALVLLGGSSLGWFGNNDHTDTTKLAEVANLSGTGTVEPVKPTPQVVYVYVTPEVTEAPTEVPTDVPTEVPTSTPTTKPTEAPTLEPVKASPETPTEAPTMAPTKEPEPTEVPEVHAEYTETGTVTFAIEKQKKVTISRFTYAGGYIPDDDPWYSELEKEVEGSYGPSLEGETIEEGVYNWLHELPKSPLQIIRARVQIGLEKLDSLQAETQRAWEIARLPKAEYDEIANDTLEHLFEALEGGKILITTDWELENFMQEVKDEESDYPLEVRGRLNGDDDKVREEKDVLITIVDKAGKNYISAPRGLANTANDAHVGVKEFDVRAWVNLTEGGTWKWKRGGGGKPTPVPTDPPTPPPTDPPTPPPTDPSTDPPTEPPTEPPTPVPETPTPRPIKDPNQRPTVSDAPVGGGPTNPENSEDPHTTDAPPTSTLAPANTPPPAPTTAPTEVPIAEVRPTEVCEVPASPPIREDLKSTPPPDPDHDVPAADAAIVNDGNNTTDFDPDSV